PGFVEHRGQILFELEAEVVRIFVDPPKQAKHHVLQISTNGLAHPNPAAEQLADERAEAATQIIQLLSLLITPRQERLIQRHRPRGLAPNERRELRVEELEVAHERIAASVADELAEIQHSLDLPLQPTPPH